MGSTPSQASAGAAVLGLRLFFFIFFAIGTTIFWFMVLRPLKDIARARRWAEVPCQIESMTLRDFRVKRGYRKEPVIHYRYDFAGREWVAERYSFFERGMFTGSAYAYEAQRKYQPGSWHRCWVNPAEPSEAVLERGPLSPLWWSFFPPPFMALGALAFVPAKYLRGGGPLRKRRRLFDKSEAANASESHRPAEARSWLKQRSTPLGRVLAASAKTLVAGIVLALFWPVTGAPWKVWFSWGKIVEDLLRDSAKLWSSTSLGLLVHTLFTAVLFFGCVEIFRMLWRLRWPRLRVRLVGDHARLGAAAEAQWVVENARRGYLHCKFDLVGFEQCQIFHGKARRNRWCRFHDQPLVLRSGGALAEGTFTISTPADSMHSFRRNFASVGWMIRGVMQLANGRTVVEHFELTVLPAGRRRPSALARVELPTA